MEALLIRALGESSIAKESPRELRDLVARIKRAMNIETVFWKADEAIPEIWNYV